jgi:hypothetical protein
MYPQPARADLRNELERASKYHYGSEKSMGCEDEVSRCIPRDMTLDEEACLRPPLKVSLRRRCPVECDDIVEERPLPNQRCDEPARDGDLECGRN